MKNLERTAKWHREHPVRVRELKRKWREKNQGRALYLARTWREKNQEKARKQAAASYENQRERIRNEIFELLGKKCARCGFSDARALEIDHVNGGGSIERKLYSGSMYHKHIIAKIKAGSKDYQILCANCNKIKAVENGEKRRKR